MKYRSVLSPGAQADMDSASRWYRNIDLNLAYSFLLETATTRRRIERFPYQFPIVEGITRRALLKRFPYSIFFDLYDDEASVIAVVHQRRSDTIWRNRVNARTEQDHL